MFILEKIWQKIKDGAYVIKLDEYGDIGTHWIPLFCNRSGIIYFDSFGANMFLKKLKNLLGNIIANIFRVQANNSIMCGYVCNGFIDFMFTDEKLTDFASLLSPHNSKKNDNIILSCFKDE